MAESIDLIDATRKMIASHLSEVNTCLPGVIVSYDNGRASVLPTASKRFTDGDVLPYPIVQNVRVCWPSFVGGSAGIKGPVTPGDKCLLIFAQQAVDGTDDMRRHDLSDAYAVMCDLGNAGLGDSGNNSDMTMFYGQAYIHITAGGAVYINAPGGVTINTPDTLNTGTLTTEDTLTYLNGMAGKGGTVGTTMEGNFNHTAGTITSLGRKIDGTHTHGGVQSGGSNTAVPNA